MTLLTLATIAVRIILYGAGILALFVLIVAAFAPRAVDGPGDLSDLDLLDRPRPCDCEDDQCLWCTARTGLTEWDLAVDEDDPADLCDAYPHECEWDDIHLDADPWGPTTTVCLTHQRTTS